MNTIVKYSDFIIDTNGFIETPDDVRPYTDKYYEAKMRSLINRNINKKLIDRLLQNNPDLVLAINKPEGEK